MPRRFEQFMPENPPGAGAETKSSDFAEVAKALAAERDAAQAEAQNAKAEAAKAAASNGKILGRLAETYHLADVGRLVHPNAGASLPAIELGEDYQPTEASKAARAKWFADNDWAVKKAAAADDGKKVEVNTPAKTGEATTIDVNYWRRLRREQPAEFRARKAEWAAWCAQQDILNKKR